MPNWCSNTMTISHPDPNMVTKALDAWNSGKFLQTLIPCPQDLIDTMSGYFGDEEKQKELEKKQAANLDKYGYPTWWEYCVTEWGTKWDVGQDQYQDSPIPINNGFSVSFESAWSPPCEGYAKLKKQGYVITAYYYEPGCDFCGRWIDGVDECYEVSKGNIPEDIDDEMGISELE
jgi:hypothetical protein